jgi:hypothetical protein
MGPLTGLLVHFRPQTHTRLNIAYIAQRDTTHHFHCTEVHHLARCLLQNVALLAIAFGADLRLTQRQTLCPSGAVLAAAQSLLQGGIPLVASLLARPQHPP